MVYEFTGNDSNTYTYGHRLLFSEEYKYILNAHGDVEVLIESDNTFVHRYRYDAFGNELNPSDNDTNPFRYCAEYFDLETGQIYLRARYYQPVIGRFTQLDPIRDGLNWYAYCLNNPVAFVDPSGYELEIMGTLEEQLLILGQLQMLTDYQLYLDGNYVKYDSSKEIDNEKYESGNKLLSNIINNTDYTCYIVIDYNDDNGAMIDYGNNITDAFNATNGIGTNAIISINPGTQGKKVATINPAGYVEAIARPLYIGIAHELIHADSFMRGVSASVSMECTQYFIIQDKNGNLMPKKSITPLRELITIGIIYNPYNIVTENDIRKEHGLLLRGAHCSV